MAVHRIQELLGLMQKNLECSICLELMKNPVATKCEHYFCRFCITEFLETKRSVPCPLCKQPVTKRSLVEKKEFGNIVDGVNNLISAFQQDSGIAYSPPKGPQTFFPCTPEAINCKQDNEKKVRTRKNVRNGKAPLKSFEEAIISAADRQNSDNDADHNIFAVPSTDHLINGGQSSPAMSETTTKEPFNRNRTTRTEQRQTRNRSGTKSPLSQAFTASPSHTDQHDYSSDKLRSRTNTAKREQDTARLLQYLDEGSCGLGREDDFPQESDSPSAQPASVQSEEENIRKLADHSCEASQTKSAVHVMEGPEVIEMESDNEESHSLNGAHSSREISQMNERNRQSRMQTDKENLIESAMDQQCKSSKGVQLKSALADLSQNSSDSSITSTQQTLQPPPVVTRTYSRRSTRSSSDKKVEEWIAAFPSGRQSKGKRFKEQQSEHGRNKEQGKESGDGKESVSTHGWQEVQVSSKNRPPGENENALHQGPDQPVVEIAKESTVTKSEINQSLTSMLPESCEDITPTPPVRKKQIFKRKSTRADDESGFPKDPFAENSPEQRSTAADPYLFVVGHTPVSKAKRKGHQRSKEKKGKEPAVPLFDLCSNKKKTVRFSEVTSEEVIPGNGMFAENMHEHTASDISENIEASTTGPLSERCSILIATKDTDKEKRTYTRSRSKAQSPQSTDHNSSMDENHSAQPKKSRRKNRNKGDDGEVQKIREEQTQELASWIGQAEDHALLFSTQEAVESIESLETSAGGGDGDDTCTSILTESECQSTGVIALAVDEDDSNDGVCLVGPLADEKSLRTPDIHQNKDFDAIVHEGPSSAKKIPGDLGKGRSMAADPDVLSSKGELPIGGENPVTESPAQHENTALSLSSKSPGRPLNGTDTVAETQLSALESPSSRYNIVLPSPMVGSALPKFSTPVVQTARQTRSNIEQIHTPDSEWQTVQSKQGITEVDETPRTLCSDTEIKGVSGECDKTCIVADKGSPVLQEKRSLDYASPAPTVKKSTVNTRDGIHSPNRNKPHTESTGNSSGRLRRLRRNLRTSSLVVTEIPCTFTETPSTAPSAISQNGQQVELLSKDKEDTENNHASPVNRKLSSCILLSGEPRLPGKRSKRDGPTESTQLNSGNKNVRTVQMCDQQELTSLNQHEQMDLDTSRNKPVHVLKAQDNGSEVTGVRIQEQSDLGGQVQLSCNDDDLETMHDSSSTDDLDITPADNEYEKPNLELQSDEVQQRYSAGLSTQESLFHSTPAVHSNAGPSHSSATQEGVIICTSKSSKTGETHHEKESSLQTISQEVQLERRKELSGEMRQAGHSEQMDSTVTHVPESLSSVFHIPESIEVDNASSSTRTPPLKLSRSVDMLIEGTSSGSHGDSTCQGSPAQSRKLSRRKKVKRNAMQQKEESDVSHASSPHDSFSPLRPIETQQSRFSMNSSSPSQSILQPTRVEKESPQRSSPLLQQATDGVGKSGTVPSSPPVLNNANAEPEPPASPKFSSPCKKKFRSSCTLKTATLEAVQLNLKGVCSSQTEDVEELDTKGGKTAEDENFDCHNSLDGENKVSTDSGDGAIHQSSNEVDPCVRETEDAVYGDRLSEKTDHDRLKLLVLDTQSLQRAEEQSVPLLSEQVIAGSLSDNEEVSQDHCEDQTVVTALLSNKSSEVLPSLENRTLDVERSIAPTTSSPASAFSPEEQHTSPCEQPSSPPEVISLQAKEKADERPSPSPNTRKRKLTSKNGGTSPKLSTSPSCHLNTPQFPLSSPPSSASSKVINSAPPGATSVLAGSDDDGVDDVRIVRRTKRKCFSLDGSPLKPNILSIKRRRFGGRQRNLSGKIDQEPGEGGQNSLVEETSSKAMGNKQGDSQSLLKNMVELGEQHVSEDIPVSEIAGESLTDMISCPANTETSREKNSNPILVPKISPMHSGKKTARGLARGNASPSDRNSRTRNMKDPILADCDQPKTAIRKSLLSGESEDVSLLDRTGADADNQYEGLNEVGFHLSAHKEAPYMHVQISEDEQLLEVEDLEGKVSSKEAEEDTAHQLSSVKQWEAVNVMSLSEPEGEKLTTSEHIKPPDHHKEAAGSVDRPIIVSQSSLRSETQRPMTVTQSSVQASMDDATIPPPSFDLQFESEDEVGEVDKPVDIATEEDTEKTANEEKIAAVQKGLLRQSKNVEVVKHVNSPAVEKQKLDRNIAHTKQDVQIYGAEGEETEEDLPIKHLPSCQAKSPGSAQMQAADSGESSEEEEVLVKKKSRRAIIESDSDFDHNTGEESETSMHLNFTSSSALSSQSEIPNTQERSKMESELERLRREIAEMEAKLHGHASSTKSGSTRDGNDHSSLVHHVKKETEPQLSADSSSLDEDEEFSMHMRRAKSKVGKKERAQLRTRKLRQRQCISSDEDEDDCDVRAEEEENVASPGSATKPLSVLQTPRQKEKNNGSDEDSSDLFLSPLSPSPPPPIKHSLARKEHYAQPRSLFMAESPSLSSNSYAGKIRHSLDFKITTLESIRGRQGSAEGEGKKHDGEGNKCDDVQNSPVSNSGSLKKIPESQLSAAAASTLTPKSDNDGMSSQKSVAVVESGSKLIDDDASDSSGSSLPSPLRDHGEHVKEIERSPQKDASCDEKDDSELPKWKREKFSFISSGLDQEKMCLLRTLAEGQECKVYSKFNEHVTHVIMKTARGSRVCERTLKYFQGIAGQCWVLSFDWVTDSSAAGHFVPEKEYEIQGDSVKGENHRGPSSSRLATSPLLAGCAFASVGVSPDMSKKELTQLVTLMGGEVVEDPWDLASHAAQYKLVLRCVDSDAHPPTPAEVELFNGQYKHFGLVTVAREWILDSICTHHLQKLDDYVFNTCTDLRLPF